MRKAIQSTAIIILIKEKMSLATLEMKALPEMRTASIMIAVPEKKVASEMITPLAMTAVSEKSTAPEMKKNQKMRVAPVKK